MNVLEFLSTIVQALAWPVSVILIVYILKKPFTELVKGVSKLKYQDLEIDFSEKLALIDKNISDKNKLHTEKEYIKPEEAEEAEEIETIANISPSSAILMAWRLVENEMKEAIIRLAISVDYSLDNLPYRNLKLLMDYNLIDRDTANAINDLRKLRNNAAHATENITTNTALRYYNIAKEVIVILRSLKRNEEHDSKTK